MPVIIRGKTLCHACRHPIGEGELIVSFSPFVTNAADPLHQFNDAVFHTSCFERLVLAQTARATYDAVRSAAEHRTCVACESPITSPDEWFGAGILSSDPSSTLARYNGLQLHRSCLGDWDGLSEFVSDLESAKQSGELRGPAVDNLLDELRSRLPQSAAR
ncbi:MAG: hypothetical protein KY476_02040 [Planctomycetes bacterium]|nr:hypothetical protein [Planctomycetota bacterium]